MRTILGLLVALTGVASADPDPRCQQFTNLNAPTPTLAQEARISYASCIASRRLDAVVLTSNIDASRAALDDAIAPAVAVLDGVIAAGNPITRLFADQIEADLYVGMVVRLRNSEAPLDPTVNIIADRWLERADWSFADVEQIASNFPELRSNPVAAYDIDNSVAALDMTDTLVGTRS